MKRYAAQRRLIYAAEPVRYQKRRKMSLTVNIYYKGKNGSALAFAREMTESGVVGRILAEEGNERYEYFVPLNDPETVLLIDAWKDKSALDRHHASPMMTEIAALRDKYDLTMRVEKYVSDTDAFGEEDKKFIRS